MADAVIPDKIVEAVAVDNVKTVAGQPASLANLAHANAVAFQQAMNSVMVATTTKAVELILGTSPQEGGAAIAALQQLMKGAQTTPPPTP